MCCRLFAAIAVIAWAGSVLADRENQDPEDVLGNWEVVRVDMGAGSKQARFAPDGRIGLLVNKDGVAEIEANGQILARGRVTADANGQFRFDAEGDTKASLIGTWGGDGARLIISFEFHGVPTSVLLEPPVVVGRNK